MSVVEQGRWLEDVDTGQRVYVYRPLRHGSLLAWVMLACAGPLVCLGAVLGEFFTPLVPVVLIVAGLATMVICAVAAGKVQDAMQVAPAELVTLPEVQAGQLGSVVPQVLDRERPALGR